MNEDRRKTLAKLQDRVNEIRSELETVISEEQEYYDNMPESFQSGEKGEKAQAAISAMEDAINELESLDVYLDTAKE